MDQLNLFAPVTALAQPVALPLGMPLGVHKRWQRAMQPDVLEEAMKIAAARAGDWLGWYAFRVVIEKYQIGFCFGQVLHRLVCAGQLEEQKVYFGSGVGAESPGSPNYQGFGSLWRAPMTEVA
jgi:hypothetical protein